MLAEKEKTIIRLTTFICLLLAAVFVIFWIIEKNSVDTEKIAQLQQTQKADEQKPAADSEEKKEDSKQQVTIRDVIKAGRTWRAGFVEWYGQEVPDIVLTDIEGKEHRLSSYRGRNVLIIIWGTWCGPCVMEVPGLKKLRQTYSEDELAMLAISNENADLVKRFADYYKLNYSVFSHNTFAMPAPFRQAMAVPTTFFIDPEGKIKLVAEGLIYVDEIEAALRAEPLK